MDKLIRYLIQVLVLLSVYFASAKFGLGIDAVSGFATLVWLPTGISLAALLIYGYKLWPAIFLGAFVVNDLAGASHWVALGIAAGNTLEALWGALLLKKVAKFSRSFERLRDSLSLIFFGAGISTLISATIGTSSLFLGNQIQASALGPTWFTWWIGDMISDLIIAPVILVWSFNYKVDINPKKISEEVLAYIILIAIAVYVFINRLPLTYIIFPPLIWISLRFSPRSAISASFILVLIATYQTLSGHGPFARQTISQSLLFSQTFMCAISITTLIMATVSAERKKLETLKDEFIGYASHELKTPITSISIFASVLKRNLKKGDKKSSLHYVNRMEDQISRLIKLINDLLDVSKAQVGKLEFNKAPFSLKILLNDVVSSFRETNPSFKVNISGTIGKKVYGDKQRIEQVLLNLLSNSVKYSSRSRKIDINVKSNVNEIIVEVRDYGIGISGEFQDRVFERFFRVHDGNTKTLSGFGIGLFLASRIIHEHGGRIWVESKPKKGSSFYFTLPVSKPLQARRRKSK